MTRRGIGGIERRCSKDVLRNRRDRMRVENLALRRAVLDELLS
jgi:hypothetical protein